MVASMGNCCQICGYDKCNEALEFHHIDPDEKELAFGKVTANPKAWDIIVKELRKCILLCSNCHKEVHAVFVDLPECYATFDESFSVYDQKELSYCPICGEEKNSKNVTCSSRCAGKKNSKVNWDDIDLPELKKRLTNVKIADILGVTEAAVRKRLKILKQKD